MIVDEHDYLDFTKVPESKGIPTSVRLIASIGVLGVFIMGGLSIGMSGFGHCADATSSASCPNTYTAWPSEKTLRMPLPSIQK